MALKFSMILEAIDRASAPAKRARASISQLTAGVRKWGQDVRKVSRDIESGSRSIEHYERRARRLRQVALGSVFRAAGQQARRFADSLDRGIKKLDLMGRAGRGAKAGLGWIGGKALGMAQWGAAGVAAAASWSIFDLFRTAGQAEQYQIMLEGIEGSAARAKKATRWVQKFAETTPYELEQVMEAFVALKAYGIDPMNGSLLSLGDGASGMTKPLMQAVEALADATTGEFERLKEFGIRASKEGDRVVFSYRKNGKDMRREAKATGSEIEKAVTGIFTERFGGGMVRQSKSFFGILSNLKDMWSKFEIMVADAGIFDKVKGKLDGFYQKLDTLAKNGKLAQWAEKTSDNLEKAFDWGVKFVDETDWKRVGEDLRRIADAVVILARELAWAVEKARDLQWMNDFNPMFGGLVGKWIRESGKPDDPPAPAAKGGKPPKKPATRLPSDQMWKGSSPASPYLRAPAIGVRKTAANDTRVGGQLDVRVKVEGPGTARVAGVRSVNRNVPIKASIGRVMTGAA